MVSNHAKMALKEEHSKGHSQIKNGACQRASFSSLCVIKVQSAANIRLTFPWAGCLFFSSCSIQAVKRAHLICL